MKNHILHLCNYSAIENVENHLNLVTIKDAIVFYSINMTQIQSEYLKKLFKNVNIYFIVTNDRENVSTINHDQWLNLVNQYKKTLTWK